MMAGNGRQLQAQGVKSFILLELAYSVTVSLANVITLPSYSILLCHPHWSETILITPQSQHRAHGSDPYIFRGHAVQLQRVVEGGNSSSRPLVGARRAPLSTICVHFHYFS